MAWASPSPAYPKDETDSTGMAKGLRATHQTSVPPIDIEVGFVCHVAVKSKRLSCEDLLITWEFQAVCPNLIARGTGQDDRVSAGVLGSLPPSPVHMCKLWTVVLIYDM